MSIGKETSSANLWVKGLPPNLAADEPSQSFPMKGVDIAIAALQSELGFLSGSIISHVQTAEMNNQSLNSLALIGARYTHTALEVLFQLSSYYLFALCQALDLRNRHRSFLASLKPEFDALVEGMLETLGHEDVDMLKAEIWPRFQKELSTRTTLDSAHRIREAMIALRPLILGKRIPCIGRFPIKTWAPSSHGRASFRFEGYSRPPNICFIPWFHNHGMGQKSVKRMKESALVPGSDRENKTSTSELRQVTFDLTPEPG